MPNSASTLAFKTLAGVTADDLTSSPADGLEADNCNYYASVENGANVLFPGKMAGGAWFDSKFYGSN